MCMSFILRSLRLFAANPIPDFWQESNRCFFHTKDVFSISIRLNAVDGGSHCCRHSDRKKAALKNQIYENNGKPPQYTLCR